MNISKQITIVLALSGAIISGPTISMKILEPKFKQISPIVDKHFNSQAAMKAIDAARYGKYYSYGKQATME